MGCDHFQTLPRKQMVSLLWYENITYDNKWEALISCLGEKRKRKENIRGRKKKTVCVPARVELNLKPFVDKDCLCKYILFGSSTLRQGRGKER